MPGIADPSAASLRPVLLDHLPWSSFDYVEGISAAGDRRVQVASLLRPLPAPLDLRFVHGAGDDATLVLAQVLPWDSAFFGYGVARLDGMFAVSPPLDRPAADRAAAARELLRRARELGVRYLFAPVDARDTATLRALGATGFALIESRLHQHRALAGDLAPERHRIREAVAADLPLLERTAREMVNPYDRFHSDPLVAPDADRLMERWVRESVAGGFADATFVPDHPAPEAFCTMRLHQEHWRDWGVALAQPVVLGAVAPAFKGWYRKLIGEICVRLRDRGAEHAYFVTQVTNRAALRSVEALGFRIGRGEHVLRTVP